jgi:prepilin-type N-terminal cleavage/methylation domain-containing protein
MMMKFRRAFTLVEMVVALTIMAVLLSLAFPAMKALKEHEEPVHLTGLFDLMRELQRRAVAEGRPYQMVFDFQGFHGLRYFYPYQEETTFKDFLVKLEEERQQRKEEIQRMEIQRMQLAQETLEGEEGAVSALPNIDDEYFVRAVALPEDMRMEVRPWGDLLWKPLEGAAIHRWVFQPTGFCDPLQIRFGAEGQWHELTFEVLTGELGAQRRYPQ